MKKIFGFSLALFVAAVFELVWAFAPRSPEGMFQAMDRISIPPQSELWRESVTPYSPICLRDYPGECPYAHCGWNLAEPMNYETLEAMVKDANPDFYFASDKNTIDEQGHCERACTFFAQITTNKKYKVEISYYPPDDRSASISITVMKVHLL